MSAYPTLEKIEYDLSRLYGFPVAGLPNGLKFILWQTWNYSNIEIPPDATDEEIEEINSFKEMMATFNIWAAEGVEEFQEQLSRHEDSIIRHAEVNGDDKQKKRLLAG